MFVAVAMAAGAVAVVAPVWLQGFVLGGSACGGGGNEQRCTGIARQQSDRPDRALGRCPVRRFRRARSDDRDRCEARAFFQRRHVRASDGGLGAFLAPALLELRRDALRRYEGTRTEPGGPLYEREQILDSFFVRPQNGWRFLRAAIVVLFFAAGLETVRRIIRRPALAVATTATVGMVIWARIVERATSCNPDGSECYDGLLTIYAVAVAGAVWTVYFAGVIVGRVAARFTRPRG